MSTLYAHNNIDALELTRVTSALEILAAFNTSKPASVEMSHNGSLACSREASIR